MTLFVKPWKLCVATKMALYAGELRPCGLTFYHYFHVDSVSEKERFLNAADALRPAINLKHAKWGMICL